MKLTPLQNNFSAGELSELLYSRSDLKAYNTGLEVMENMIPDSRGPAVSRPGTTFVGSYSGNYGRLLTFQVTDALFFLGVLTNLKMYIASPVGGVPAENQIVNSRFLQGGDNWTVSTAGGSSFVSFAPFATQMYGSGGPNAFAQISQQVTMTNNTVQHTVKVAGGAQDTIRIKIGTVQGGTDLANVITNTYVTEVDFTPNPSFSYYWVTVEHSETDSTTDLTVTIASIEGYESNSGVVEFTTPWTEGALRDLHVIQAPAGDTYYFTHPNFPVYKMIFDEASYTFTFTQVTFTGAPASWTGNNWPATGAIYQGRLFLGGTPSEPENFWASKSGSYEDFTIGTTDSDGFESVIANYGRIRWMIGTKTLVIGTQNGEYIVTALNKTLTPSDRNIEQQSSYGSNRLQAGQVGDQIFYVSPDGTKLRAMEYEWTKDNWLSRDLTYASEHITNGGLVDFGWQQNPNNVLWAVRADGTECSMTYERSENIYGWTRHVPPSDQPNPYAYIAGVVAMTVPQYYGYSMLYTLTQRRPDYLYLELQAPYARSTRIGPRIFMDSHVGREYINGTTIVDRLEHLEGYTVQVITDGAVHPDKQVQNGQITLDYEAFFIDVGLKYYKRIKTLPFDAEIPGGKMTSHKKHRNKIYVRIIDSAKPLVNGVRPAERYPSTPMNTMQPPVTEDIMVTDLGHDLYASVEINQDLPLPLIVSGIYGEMAGGKL